MLFLQTIILGLLLGGVYALAAAGLTLIFGVMRIINIAHGVFLVLASFLTFTAWSVLGIDPLLAVLLTVPITFGLGWLTYRITMKPLREAPIASTVLLTFGIALTLEAVIGFVWGNESTSIRPPYAGQAFTVFGLFIPKVQLYGGLMALAVLALLGALVTRTWLGRAIRAAATNAPSAELVGISVASVSGLVFAIGTATAGAAGAIAGVLYPFVPGSHYQWIARLLAIVVLGGMGSMRGAVLGAVIFGLAETLTATYIAPDWATAVPYLIVFGVLLARPQGLLGTRTREDTVTA
ncbi:branched-chain amino acid ABC transporter permease [Enemella evansiae]|uniref:branched-chain amino acid ABC transporter permease n=1 Tax=Enemella evansiae TaxID=2016499 RepID=UPI000B9740E8|nr:branched-chain amino acid ABC transporter permease [Enemella evansiae]OYO00209.1 branched-chain amino acid ABC transporter permease [Enemella evansiae]OYO04926.1 branched-chain amino acid ABC transporter permease [Enemella evansiae]